MTNQKTAHDDAVMEVAAAMEEIRLPSDSLSCDDIAKAGPPADPIEFPRPRFERGRRDSVLCYNPNTQEHQEAKNVLFRDYSREFADADQRLTCAYWPVPNKEPIKTIMGHVEICIVLTRCKADDSLASDSYDSEDDEDEEEEDIVFQMTTDFVAVKVNYCHTMDKLRNRHAEDPLKEIAAMQLIGNSHPNVLGVREVLFDGQNLNVVMPYCGSGDLFQLLQENQGTQMDTPGLTEGQARFWFRQIVAGIHHLHSKAGICHRDLSPENIMIDKKGCLIIDMGMALRVPYTDATDPNKVTDITHGSRRRMIKPQGACGKLPYMSPEIYRNKHPFDAPAVDLWTAGTILFCMVTGNRSYQRPLPDDPQFYWMTHGLEVLLNDWGVKLSNEGRDLLQNLLQVDPRLRLTLDEVVNHPWFAQPDEPMIV